MKQIWELFAAFFKIGLFTFGGGYAMLPLLQDEVCRRRGFCGEKELLDLYSIGQITPGIICVNVATFVGYRQRGIGGAIAATLGIVLPSMVIITLIAMILKPYMHNRYVIYAFSGVRICVVALIAEALIGLWQRGVKDRSGAVIFAGSLLLLTLVNLSAVWVVLLAAGASLLLKRIRLK